MLNVDDNEYDGDFPIIDCEPGGVFANFEDGSPLGTSGTPKVYSRTYLYDACACSSG